MTRIIKRKKANYLKYIFDRRLISLFFIVFLLVLTFLTASYSQSSKNTNLQTKAAAAGCQCSDSSHCYPDMCSRDPNKLATVCSDFPNDGPQPGTIDPYFCTTPPDCCTDLASLHDAYKCCWIERGFCRPDQCQQITGNKGKCGWYWGFHDGNTNTPDGYGCMIGDSEATMRPKYGPTASPTSTPILPTQTPAITNTPIPSSSITPTNTPASSTPTGTVTPLSPTNTPQVTVTIAPTVTSRPTVTSTVTPYPLISPMLPKTPPNPYPSPPYCI